MPVPEEARTTTLQRLLWSTAAGLGALALLVFLFATSHRLFYPHELEWMEGALVDHAARIANGRPLYCAPGPEHVPFLYAPLLSWLGGLLTKIGFTGLFALRLVGTTASLGCALLLGHWVRRETGRNVPGLVAAGMFFAGYGWLSWWYDLARNDSLFVLAMLACGYQLRHGGKRRWLVAAAFATAAFLAKQSALLWLPALAVGAFCLDRRQALRFVGASVAAMGIATAWMHVASDGWSTFWIFEMPRHHGWNDTMWLGFWTTSVVQLVPSLVLAVLGFVVACRSGRARTALFLAAVGAGGLAASWFSVLHVGGYDNVMMYAFAGACLLGPIAAAEPGHLMRFGGPLLLLVQFGLLGHAAWQREPLRTLLPHPAHRRAHDELLQFVRAQSGPVWIPGHGGITAAASRGTGAHGQAIFDLLQLLPKLPDGQFDLDALVDRRKLQHLSARAREAIGGFHDGVLAALRERRFAAIVVDEVGTGMFPALFAAGLDAYVRSTTPLLTEPTALRPLVGYDVHSPWALVRRP